MIRGYGRSVEQFGTVTENRDTRKGLPTDHRPRCACTEIIHMNTRQTVQCFAQCAASPMGKRITQQYHDGKLRLDIGKAERLTGDDDGVPFYALTRIVRDRSRGRASLRPARRRDDGQRRYE
ncbi:hypothetical protein GCM10023208_15470 [Erythrobacter westpacificensis]|uniref:Uncharacterized protein n=1 Tax=Erythrobacter westpacificensis TaxID=1055231 RepID=A0ABP9K8Z2_9SPHN